MQAWSWSGEWDHVREGRGQGHLRRCRERLQAAACHSSVLSRQGWGSGKVHCAWGGGQGLGARLKVGQQAEPYNSK